MGLENTIKLVKPIYPCQAVPVIAFGNRCPKVCLYCDLCQRDFSKTNTLASGQESILKTLKKYKGAYFSAVSDCFLPANKQTTHNLLKEIWKLNPDFVPLIVTKQIIPETTIKLLIKNKHRVVVQISVPSLNNKLVSILEPGAATIADRLKTIKKLSAGGVAVTAVVMPWFNVYDKSEKIEDLPKKLAQIGIKRCILGTGVLPEEQRQKMLELKNKLVIEALKQLSQIKKVTTKVGYTMPIKKRILSFSKMVKVCKKFGIKARICTADNLDLINKTKLPLCVKFKHPYFLKD